MKRYLRYIIFFVVVGIFWGSFFITWQTLEHGDLKGIQEVTFFIRNDRNNGTCLVEIEYNLDFNKTLDYNERIDNNLTKAEQSPFYIDFLRFCTF